LFYRKWELLVIFHSTAEGKVLLAQDIGIPSKAMFMNIDHGNQTNTFYKYLGSVGRIT